MNGDSAGEQFGMFKAFESDHKSERCIASLKFLSFERLRLRNVKILKILEWACGVEEQNVY